MRRLSRFIIVAVVVAACHPTAPAPPANPSPVVLPSAAATPTAGPTSRTPLGGTLRVALAAPIGSLDPRSPDVNPLVASQIFEGLVARGTAGVVPALATKWRVGPDGRAWTFTLRDGVTFHDGTALDAAAVVKSLGRANDPLIANADAPDDRTVVLTTRAPYGPFLR
ncbi:MAG: ABC transporter substrate-binding protein, partial [Candidatus Limnocylindria bacterium]